MQFKDKEVRGGKKIYADDLTPVPPVRRVVKVNYNYDEPARSKLRLPGERWMLLLGILIMGNMITFSILCYALVYILLRVR